ncbi:hypothetical protein EJ02DRAFT_504780 [Clathrospora elynae]|uniref:Uncharacterized protein n=1 Tax=Clathrospora elynae TaxID=706981 RepID=A0A6A5SIG7_9PLEO|nr:hypothetical protein EJ02DRAFT_504780 [Clathrospora elynae]
MEYTPPPTHCDPPSTVDPPPTPPHPTLDLSLVTPSSVPEPSFLPHYETPLYTEIAIPLPHLPTPRHPSPSPCSPANPPPRPRSRTLSSLSPFLHLRSSSTSSSSYNQKDSEEWPRIRKDVIKSKEVHAMMDLRHANKRHRNRSGTIDALAVVPAVLVLSAELFTPGTGEGGKEDRGKVRKYSGVGRWEDGIR